MKNLLLAFLFSFAVFGQDKQVTGTWVANTRNAIITNLTLPNIPITNLLRLTAQGSITNAAIGTGLAFDGTTLSANGSIVGAGGGNAQTTGAATTANIPFYTDTTGTNIGPSTTIFLSAGTNVTVKGIGSFNGIVATNGISSGVSSVGSLTLGDGGAESFRIAPPDLSTSINLIPSTAPAGGFWFGTVSATTNETITHVSTVGVTSGGSGTATAFTAGSVVFAGASGVYSQDNANLFFDNANNFLGVGTASPIAPLEVHGFSAADWSVSGYRRGTILDGNGASVYNVVLSEGSTSSPSWGIGAFGAGLNFTSNTRNDATGVIFTSLIMGTNGFLNVPLLVASKGLFTSSAKDITTTGVLGLDQGGSGQATANAALNAFLPTQTSQSGKVLTTDGSNTSWAAAGGGSGTAGTVINTGTPVQFSIPYYSDTTGTNVAPIAAPLSGTIPVVWVLTNNSLTIQFKKLPMVDELTGGNQNSGMGWTADSLGTGGNASTGDAQDFGVLNCSTGSGTNGAAAWETRGTSGFFDTPTITCRMRVKTPATLSTDTDVYRIYCGFGDGTTAEPVDGAYFQYSHGTASGNWSAKTSSASSRTVITTTGNVAVTADAWWELMVSGNSTVVNFWVSSNDGATWTHIGYCSANIPKTSGEVFGIFFRIIKEAGLVGTANKIFSCGRVSFWPN